MNRLLGYRVKVRFCGLLGLYPVERERERRKREKRGAGRRSAGRRRVATAASSPGRRRTGKSGRIRRREIEKKEKEEEEEEMGGAATARAELTTHRSGRRSKSQKGGDKRVSERLIEGDREIEER